MDRVMDQWTKRQGGRNHWGWTHTHTQNNSNLKKWGQFKRPLGHQVC